MDFDGFIYRLYKGPQKTNCKLTWQKSLFNHLSVSTAVFPQGHPDKSSSKARQAPARSPLKPITLHAARNSCQLQPEVTWEEISVV